MSERRPHWDDGGWPRNAKPLDLIAAVSDAMESSAYHDEIVFEIIAAVEDWAKWEHVPKGTLARMERQKAAIERVRELCEDKYVGPPTTYGEGFQNGYNDALYQVLRALDALCPTCSGPIRETVGLVCQTCGTDYGASDE